MKVASPTSNTQKANEGGRWKWYHGMLFYIVAQVLSFGLNGLVTLSRSDRRKSLGQAVQSTTRCSVLMTSHLEAHRAQSWSAPG
jgi:hypothetical protein